MEDPAPQESQAEWPVDSKVGPEDRIRIFQKIPKPVSLGPVDTGGFYIIEHWVSLQEFWEMIKPAGSWTVEAVGTGVVGSVAYDAIKKFAKRVPERLPEGIGGPEGINAPEGIDHKTVARIAMYAIRLRCQELRLPAPPFATLRAKWASYGYYYPEYREGDYPEYETGERCWNVYVVNGQGNANFSASCLVMARDLRVIHIEITISGIR